MSLNRIGITQKLLVIVVGLTLLILFIFISIMVGAKDISNRTVFDAIFRFDPDSVPQQIIRELRLSRTIMAVIAGACFAVSGAMMQGMTRNPLASPDLLGINAGATFALAVVLSFFPLLPFQSIIVFSMGNLNATEIGAL